MYKLDINRLHKSRVASLGLALSIGGIQSFGMLPAIAAPEPITVAVIRVKDRSNAPWFKPSYEEKLRTILSTELSNSGDFIVLERDEESLKDLKKEANRWGLFKDEEQKALTKAKYYISASLSDFTQVSDEGGSSGMGFGGFNVGGSKSKKEYYVSFDLKVVNVKTSAIAYSRSIEGSAKAGSKGSSFSGTIRGVSLGESKSKTTNVPVTRAVRAAMVESAEYLNCVLYLKDECVQEYDAKDEKRKRSNDTLDMF